MVVYRSIYNGYSSQRHYLLSTPGQAYQDGMGFIQFYFGLPIAMIILSIWVLPIYYKLKVYTAYEYLENRFDLKTRILGALLFNPKRFSCRYYHLCTFYYPFNNSWLAARIYHTYHWYIGNSVHCYWRYQSSKSNPEASNDCDDGRYDCRRSLRSTSSS